MLRKSFGLLGGAALAGGAMCGRFRRDDAVKSNCGAKVTAGFVEALEARLAKLEAQQMSKGPLDGKVALVTGGSRGLGLGMALGMAEAGAHVVLNGRGEEALVAAQAVHTTMAHAGDCRNEEYFDTPSLPEEHGAKSCVDALCEFVREAGEGGLHGADMGKFYARHPHHRAEVVAAGKVKGFCAKHPKRLRYEVDEAASGKCRILAVARPSSRS